MSSAIKPLFYSDCLIPFLWEWNQAISLPGLCVSLIVWTFEATDVAIDKATTRNLSTSFFKGRRGVLGALKGFFLRKLAIWELGFGSHNRWDRERRLSYTTSAHIRESRNNPPKFVDSKQSYNSLDVLSGGPRRERRSEWRIFTGLFTTPAEWSPSSFNCRLSR